MPKPAGITFNRYAAIAGRILRKALKPELRVPAERLDTFELRAQKWENGIPSDSKPLGVSLKN